MALKRKAQKRTRKKYVYLFHEGSARMKDLLGGKGANLAEMTRLELPVPPGFTISTEACNEFYRLGKKFPKGLMDEVSDKLKTVEKKTIKGLGNPQNPLLVSVRSGAKFSMPGMMDTILNLGLNKETLQGLIRKTNNERFAYDAYRRFVMMFGNIAMGIPRDKFEHAMKEAKKQAGVEQDTELTADDLKQVAAQNEKIYRNETGKDFPQNPVEQLEMSIYSVFNSWNNPRANAYRNLNKIPHNLGTAVNVQTMVFGNYGGDSGTGVAFTRDPSTGEGAVYADYLPNAQGEDVVAGIRTPLKIQALKEQMPGIYRQFVSICRLLERRYRDMMDIEFTVEKGTLYILQCRVGKRTGIASVKIAVEMVKEKLISKKDALLRVEPDHLNQMLAPVFHSEEKDTAVKEGRLMAKGINAGPGAATGRVVFTAGRAVALAREGAVVLVRQETNPDDIEGMAAAEGILTAIGGRTSHAAVVARGMGKPCVVGCSEIQVDEVEGLLSVNGHALKEGDYISLDGFTGEVIKGQISTRSSEVMRVLQGELPAKDAPMHAYFSKLMTWADEARELAVRANADIPRDARAARFLGAEGIGLCRTEHMFFAPERLPLMQKMILADDVKSRREALNQLLPFQKEDFKGLLKEMAGFGVTIRTLDPPLHEFLPDTLEEAEKLSSKINIPAEKIFAKSKELHEFNPMLGHRGCRLGISFPEITEMQTRAILSAACELKKEGVNVCPEIMIPLVGNVKELAHQKAIVMTAAEEVQREYNVRVKFLVGTMIEVPRACVTADEISREAQFFSFGTNDLTQMALGFSRDDSGKFLGDYLDKKNEILKEDPFQTLDVSGVGKLMETAVQLGKKTRKELKLGICGEHGGDPESIKFCHQLGLDYVSCSPYRVPIARLAAAQASIASKLERDK